jgi:glycosyltransferase involved in cell wall biosynthesis
MNGDEAAKRPIKVLHLAVDFNTPQRAKTTTAIEWLVDALDQFDNVVIAYRRVVRFGEREAEVPGKRYRLFDFPYFGLPLGLGLARAMRVAAERTIALLEREGIRPDFVHAHKLTFEGLAGYRIARHFGVPYTLSLRGEVETKVFRMKPLLRPTLRRIAAESRKLYFVSAWFRGEFRRAVPGLERQERLFPNIVRNVRPQIEPQPAGPAMVCIVNLDTWKRKGLSWLLDGFARAVAQDPALRLEFIGGGSDASRALVQGLIDARGLGANVTVLGPIPNAELLAKLPAYRALLMPSVNETFGMVYVEALFAGVPILYTRNTGIDGYLDGLDVGRAVPPRDAGAIADAVLNLSHDTQAYRARIAAAGPELFARFDTAPIIADYCADVVAAVRGAHT